MALAKRPLTGVSTMYVLREPMGGYTVKIRGPTYDNRMYKAVNYRNGLSIYRYIRMDDGAQESVSAR